MGLLETKTNLAQMGLQAGAWAELGKNDLFDKRIWVLYLKGLDGPAEFLAGQKYILKK